MSVALRRAAGPAAALAVGWAAVMLVPPWSDDSITDLPVYADYAAGFLGGELPYRDVVFEYPPLAAPVIALPGLVGTGDEPYRLAFAAFALGLLALIAFLCARVAGATGGRPVLAAVVVGLAPLLTGAMIRTHFDLAPVALALAAVLALVRGRPTLGFALIGAGAMTKGFPLLIVAPALAWLWARGEGRVAARGLVALGAVMGAVALAALVVSPGGALDAVRYHLERPVQVESGPASVLVAVGALGGEAPTGIGGFGSDNLEHPAAGAVSAVLFGLGIAVLAALVLAARAAPGDRRALVLAALAAPVALMPFAKVLSPQFLVWAIPLLALAVAWGERWLAGWLALAAALTLTWFPGRYADLVAGEALPEVLVGARNVALVVAAVLAVRAVGRRGRAPATASRDRSPGVR